MKYLFLFILLSYLYQYQSYAQDLLIVNNNDSIPCKIKEIDADSSVYYKSIPKYDLHNGYLKRDYYSEIITDYYTNLKRNSNPNNGLGFINLGLKFSHIPLNPVIEKVINNEKLLTSLSNGYAFSIAYQKFFNPTHKYYNNNRSHTNFGFGLSFEHFRRKADSIKRHINRISFFISFNTNSMYTTYFTLKPGVMLNRYSGFYDGPFKSRSTILNLGLSIDQKLFDITKEFSLFLSIEPYLLAAKSGKIEHGRINYYSTINYYDWQYDYGFSIGLTVYYFY